MVKKRTVNIREVDNGYIISLVIDSHTNELVVDSLPKLLKVIKTFFEAAIIE